MTSDHRAQTAGFWKGRRVFVTGAAGYDRVMAGQGIADPWASVVVLVQDADPQSELYRSGDIRRVSVVNGALAVAIARCGSVYGGGDLNWSRIVPGTMRSVYTSQDPVIRSNGSPVCDEGLKATYAWCQESFNVLERGSDPS